MPTVFDALRTAGGVTPFSKLSEVFVTRKLPLTTGGGKKRTQLNFLELITNGNESQNIRLVDGDTVLVARSAVELREQVIKAGQTNLSPDFFPVFVTGRVRDQGLKYYGRGVSRSGPRCHRQPKTFKGQVNLSASIVMEAQTSASFYWRN